MDQPQRVEKSVCNINVSLSSYYLLVVQINIQISVCDINVSLSSYYLLVVHINIVVGIVVIIATVVCPSECVIKQLNW